MKLILKITCFAFLFSINSKEIKAQYEHYFDWVKVWDYTSYMNFIRMETDANGDIYILGSCDGNQDFDPDSTTYIYNNSKSTFFVLKTNSSGEFLWVYPFSNNGIAHDFYLEPDGEIVVIGRFFNEIEFNYVFSSVTFESNGESDMFFIKIDDEGKLKWARHIGGDDIDEALSLTKDIYGNYVITGRFRDIVDFDPGNNEFFLESNGWSDIFVLKLKDNGWLEEAYNLGGTGGDIGHNLIKLPNGSILLTGIFKNTVDFNPNGYTHILTNIGNPQIFILKLNPSGSFAWVKHSIS